MNTARRKLPDLEKSLAELETIVEQLESGDLALEKSLKEFERACASAANVSWRSRMQNSACSC